MEVSTSAQGDEDIRKQERMRDDALAMAAQGGDREARDELYLRYRHAIRRATEPARRLAAQLDREGSHVEPEDLQGEGFIIFCDLLDLWQPERAPFVPYMLAAMARRAYHYVRDANHIRSARRTVRLVSTPDGGVELPVDTAGAPDAAGVVAGRSGWDNLAGPLSENRRRLVVLRYGRDLPTRRVALAVGRSERTVTRTLRAALSTLAEALVLEREAL